MLRPHARRRLSSNLVQEQRNAFLAHLEAHAPLQPRLLALVALAGSVRELAQGQPPAISAQVFTQVKSCALQESTALQASQLAPFAAQERAAQLPHQPQSHAL